MTDTHPPLSRDGAARGAASVHPQPPALRGGPPRASARAHPAHGDARDPHPLAGKRLSWEELAGGSGTCRTALVSGPRSLAFDVPAATPGRLLGAHFHPGGAWPLFGVPMDTVADRHCPLEDLLGASARELVARIDEARSDTQRLITLSDFLVNRARSGRAAHAAVTAMLRSSERGAGEGAVATALAASGLSHRRFIELFRREVGLTPRDFLRVQRFQRALGIAARSGRAGADLAYEAGYCDQSHWILECRKHAGLPPGELLAAQRDAGAHPPPDPPRTGCRPVARPARKTRGRGRGPLDLAD